MGILDTFFIMFDGDTTKLKKSVNETDKEVNNLKKDLNATDAMANQVGASFMNLATAAGGAIVAAMSLSAVFDNTKKAAEYTTNLGRMTEAYGQNIEMVSAWGNAVKMNGGTAEGFQSTIKSLNNDMQQMAITGTSNAIPMLARLGVSAIGANGKIKDAIDLLPDLAAKLSKMKPQQAMQIGQMLGLDEGTIMLLQKGRTAVEAQVEQMRKLDNITKESAQVSIKYQQATDMLTYALRGMFVEIGSSILPALTWFNNKLSDIIMFMREHKDFMMAFFSALGAIITAFVLPAMWSLAASVITAISPFVLLGAAVVAVAGFFALLYDDIKTFQEGGDSLIGRFVKKFPEISESIIDVIEVFKFLMNIVGTVFGFIVDAITQPSKAFDNFFNNIAHSIDGLKDRFRELFRFFADMEDKIANNPIVSGAKSLWGDAKSFFGIDEAKGQIAMANGAPVNNYSSNAIMTSALKNNRETNVSINEIKIETQATDADGISNQISSSLKDQVQMAMDNFNDGVAY